MKLTCLGAVINLVDLDPAFTYHLSKIFCKEALLVFEKDKFFYLKIVCLPLDFSMYRSVYALIQF